MKTNRNTWSYLFRPFRFIAGAKSLLAGIVILVLLSLSGFLSDTYFDGVLDVHYGCPETPAPLLIHTIWVFGSWMITFIIMYLSALIMSGRSVRLIDMAGTLAMAKAPLLLAALWGFIPMVHICMGPTIDMETMVKSTLLPAIISLPALFFSIWSIVLMYNAFSVSGNLKGTKGVLSFIIALIISEILSKVIIIMLLKSL